MSTPVQVNTLRSSDFPNGLTDKDALERLFQILNPALQQLQATTSKGTSLGQNIDGQFASFTFTAGATFAPLQVRIKDGKKPAFVLARALDTKANATVSSWNPAWTLKGQSAASGNILTVTDLVGITPGVPYEVSLYIFF